VLTFLIGLLRTGISYRIPNLAGVSVFHGVVGRLAVPAGIARKHVKNFMNFSAIRFVRRCNSFF